jgi:hypothetical protein
MLLDLWIGAALTRWRSRRAIAALTGLADGLQRRALQEDSAAVRARILGTTIELFNALEWAGHLSRPAARALAREWAVKYSAATGVPVPTGAEVIRLGARGGRRETR